MRRVAGRLLIVASLVGLAACQEQRTVVLEQSSAATLAANSVAPPVRRPSLPLSPCAPPAGTGPFEHLTRPLSGAPVPMPAKALAEHVSGCAGIRFRIGPQGAPEDVAALTEYPLGYGFAEVARSAVAGTRWPPRDDTAWRFLVINMRPGTPAGS